MIDVLRFMTKAAPTNSTVLVQGESGTGKELVVSALHRNSRRSDGPFVAVNCAALPEALLESELSVTKGVPSPARSPTRKESLSWPPAARCFWTKWVNWDPPPRPNCYAHSRNVRSTAPGPPSNPDRRHPADRRNESRVGIRSRCRLIPRGPLLSAERSVGKSTALRRAARRHPGPRPAPRFEVRNGNRPQGPRHFSRSHDHPRKPRLAR